MFHFLQSTRADDDNKRVVWLLGVRFFVESFFVSTDIKTKEESIESRTPKVCLSKEYEKNNNINQTIANAKPPIFWKEKEIVKKQITNWGSDKIKKLIIKISEIELQIKRNSFNTINITLDFIFDQSSQN